MPVIEAVVLDLDGVILDSEQLWDECRQELVAEEGGHWIPEATAAMQGMSSPEWARYLHDQLEVRLPEARIIEAVVEKLFVRYERQLPLIPGARQAVERIAQRWPVGLASSSNRVVIDRVLGLAGLDQLFRATVSSEEVERGKPAPDVYVEAARRLAAAPDRCVAVEDSANGIRAAAAAGMAVIAVPNSHYPPPAGALSAADLVLDSLDGLTVDSMLALDRDSAGRVERLLDEEEVESFPASDPHSDWAGPPV